MGMKNLVGALLIGGLLLGGTSFAMADNSVDANGNSGITANTSISAPQSPEPGMKSESMSSVLESLVASGIITQDQSDQILARQNQLQADRQNLRQQIPSKTGERPTQPKKNKPEQANMMTQMVNEGIITQEQAEAIHSAMQSKMSAQKQAEINAVLDGLVEKNLITSTQSSAILDKVMEQQAQRESWKQMTPEQRQAGMNSNQSRMNLLNELVEDGTLTQTQADEVGQVLRPSQTGMGKHMMQGNGYKNGICLQRNQQHQI